MELQPRERTTSRRAAGMTLQVAWFQRDKPNKLSGWEECQLGAMASLGIERKDNE